jgi:GNAT superfamily N-acetyltransferase
METEVRLESLAGTDRLPSAFDGLRNQARTEGYRFLDRLADDWSRGATRFNGEGEALLLGEVDGSLAGVGGMTEDPTVPGALRMRRFYVHPSFRRRGIARAFAGDLLRRCAGTDMRVTVNAAITTAAGFWEALGFERCSEPGVTHLLPARKRSIRSD